MKPEMVVLANLLEFFTYFRDYQNHAQFTWFLLKSLNI
jgi:hypothetical protein